MSALVRMPGKSDVACIARSIVSSTCRAPRGAGVLSAPAEPDTANEEVAAGGIVSEYGLGVAGCGDAGGVFVIEARALAGERHAERDYVFKVAAVPPGELFDRDDGRAGLLDYRERRSRRQGGVQYACSGRRPAACCMGAQEAAAKGSGQRCEW